MKVSDIKKAQELINEIQRCSNQIKGIKNYFKDHPNYSQNCLYINGQDSYFNGFYLTKEETENIMLRLENDRLALIEKLKELGVEMD